jgi:hypothetical protein
VLRHNKVANKVGDAAGGAAQAQMEFGAAARQAGPASLEVILELLGCNVVDPGP